MIPTTPIKIRTNEELLERIHQLPDGCTDDLNHWDVSELDDFSYAFADKNFQGNISTWNMFNARNVTGMFMNSTFNGNIEHWDVRHVVKAAYMFEHSSFNGSLEKWNVERLARANSMFRCSAFNGSLRAWQPKSIRNISHIFEYSKAIDIDIRTWQSYLRENNANVCDAFRGLRNLAIYEMLTHWGRGLVESASPVDDQEYDHLQKPDTSTMSSLLMWCLRLEFPNREDWPPLKPIEQSKWDLLVGNKLIDPELWLNVAQTMADTTKLQFLDLPSDCNFRL